MFKQKLPKQCPKCKCRLQPVSMLITDWPYIHTDIHLECTSGHKFLFGIPLDELSGSNLQIYDSNPSMLLLSGDSLPPPTCPFHDTSMRLTKIFGDKVGKDVRLQFKCEECYYLEHITLPKDYPPITRS